MIPQEPELDRLGRDGYSPAKAAGNLLDLHAGPGRVRVGRDDADEVGAEGLGVGGGDLDRDALAGSGGETVDVADEWDHYRAPSCRSSASKCEQRRLEPGDQFVDLGSR